MYRPSGEATAPSLLGRSRRGSFESGGGGGGSGGPRCTPVPPSRLYIQSSDVPIDSPALEAMTYCPSEVQEGEVYALLRPVVSGLGFEPSRSASQMFSAPERSLRNSIFLPSGENRGWLSNDNPPMMRLASPPVIGIV